MIARISEQPRGRRLAALALIVVGALALSGCADGQRAQTAIETPAVDGVGASVGAIDIRNLSIAPPAGDAAYLSARLQGAIVNNSGQDDELVSVTTKAAATVGIYISDADASASAALASSTAAASSASSSASPSSSSSSPSSSASSSASAAPSSSTPPASTGSLVIPAGRLVTIGGDGAVIELTGLTSPLQGASQISVTFTFKNAGSVTLTIAVHVPTSPMTAPTLPTSFSTAE